MQNIHCCDNLNLNMQDRFLKVRPLIDAMNKKCIDLAPEREHHSLDESIVPYYYFSMGKLFDGDTNSRWELLGYVEWFDPNQGSSTIIPDKCKRLSLAASVVL